MTSIEYDKKTGKIYCKPSTKDILISLSHVPEWGRILYEHTNAPYKEFLGSLIDKNFFRDKEEIAIGKIAKEFKMDNAKLNKSLKKIYEAIFELNNEHPGLFKQPGNLHNLSFKYYDSYCELNMWLPATPRLFEQVDLYFVNARVGVTRFTVTEVLHELQDTGSTITVFLKGGIVNPYRQWLVDRALFEGKIGLQDTWQLPGYKLDEELKKMYR